MARGVRFRSWLSWRIGLHAGETKCIEVTASLRMTKNQGERYHFAGAPKSRTTASGTLTACRALRSIVEAPIWAFPSSVRHAPARCRRFVALGSLAAHSFGQMCGRADGAVGEKAIEAGPDPNRTIGAAGATARRPLHSGTPHPLRGPAVWTRRSIPMRCNRSVKPKPAVITPIEPTIEDSSA